MSALSYFEERLKEAARTIGQLREEGCSWEELCPLEVERRALEWFVGTYYTLKNGAGRRGEDLQGHRAVYSRSDHFRRAGGIG